MKDQAAKLRDLAQGALKEAIKETKPKGPRVISVASGKGGVGKTNVVVNLGLTLAKMGQRVLIFDADLGLANVEVLLGIIPKFSLYDVLKGDKGIEEILVEGPHNIKLIPGGTGLQELANLNKLQRERIIADLQAFNDEIDIILLDTGAGINKNVLGFVAASDEVIIIATPEPTSLTDAYSLIKVLSKFKVHSEVYLLINRALNEKEATYAANKIQLVATKFLEIKINYIGFVPEDFIVGKSVKDQVPFTLGYPKSPATQGIDDVALFLTDGQRTKVKGMNGFVIKLMRLFS